MSIPALISAAAAATTAVTGAVYVNFSVRVMPRMARLPDADGIETMQQFNRTALRPPFMAAFFGSAAFSAATLASVAWTAPRGPAQWWAATGAVLGLAGFGLTVGYNVPRNEALAALPAHDPRTIPVWHTYLREWTSANSVRAVCSLAGAAALAVAAALQA